MDESNEQKNQKAHAVDFSLVLASSVHDMKNSLCMLIQSIDTLSYSEAKSDDPDPEKIEELAKIHYEASRLNTNLLQMLSFYRAEKDQLPILIEEHHLEDIIDEVLAKNTFYIENKGINVDIDVDEDLIWYLDSNLIGNLLNDVFVNALRYTKDRIGIAVEVIDNHLEIKVSDNGNGYPQHMLLNQDIAMQDLDLDNNRTGLGLFFARLIAGAHNNREKSGYIKLENDEHSGGSIFTLVIP